MPVPTSRRRGGTLTLLACGLLVAACGGQAASSTSPPTAAPTTSTPGPASSSPSPSPSTAPTMAPLVVHVADLTADLHSPPVDIPLRFKASTIGVDIPMQAVGLDSGNAMDAPGVGQEKRPAGDPVWNAGFWYRGGAEPGRPGTATIAGHLDDSLGRPAAFWNLRKLQTGDIVEIDDQRTGEVIHFRVTEAHNYSVAEASGRDVVTRLFGPQAAAAQRPEFPGDGIARLSLVTCAGSFTKGEYDHRYIVFAERSDGPASVASPATPPAAATVSG